MPVNWWATERATEPAKISLLPTEERRVAINLTPEIESGEAIVNPGTITTDVILWRTALPLNPSPKVGDHSYDAGTKTVYQLIDASLLPRSEACAILVSFDVSYGAGIDRRAAYTILVYEI